MLRTYSLLLFPPFEPLVAHRKCLWGWEIEPVDSYSVIKWSLENNEIWMLSGWPSKTDNRPSLPWKRGQITERKIIGSAAYEVH